MEIFFGLHYTNNAFLDFKNRKGIYLDHTVVGPEGLLSLLELYLGVYHEEMNLTDRQAAYYTAFRKTMAKGTNIFSNSWEKNGLCVSNECLKWRDTLRANAWNAEMKQPSKRLQILAQVEKDFHVPSFGDRLENILPFLQQQNPLPAASRILVASKDEKDLPPVIVNLLKLLQAKGTDIVYESDASIAPKETNLSRIQELLISNKSEDCLKENDNTFKIWEFPTELDVARYVVTHPKDNFNVYVTNDGKLLDNVQRMLQQPTSGCSITNAHPQIAQLFKLGLSLFEYPFNIRNLISWLLVPIHPIKSDLRRALVKVILSTSGYHNQEYADAIDSYREMIKKSSDNQEVVTETLKKLERALAIFIPDPKPSGVDKQSLLCFINSLNAWCGMMSNLENLHPMNKSQLTKVAGLCKSLASIVEEAEDALIPFRQVEGWANALYSGTDFEVYGCQAGSRWTVSSTDLAEPTDNILWTDCYNYNVAASPTDFLNKIERQVLEQQGCQFWNDADFNRAMTRAMFRPVLMCRKQLVLIVTHTSKGETVNKHPLMIRLEKAFPTSLSLIREQPDNEKVEKQTVAYVDNYSDEIELNINNKHLLEMPTTESYSSLDNLIQYPLDYVMDRILKLRDRSSTEMDAVSTVKGNVAHAVIEELFKGDTQEIAAAIDKYFNKTLLRLTEEKGAILLLQENIIEWQLFSRVSSLMFQFLVQKRYGTSSKLLIIMPL